MTLKLPWTIESIGPEEIVSLIKHRMLETLSLEFKGAMYPLGDAGQRELLRDVAAMANADGGFIIIGVEEDQLGRACNLSNVERPAVACDRIIQTCLDSIIDRIAGLKAKSIEVKPNVHIVVVCIPSSTAKPHMITKNMKTDFWRRYDRCKRRMTYAEIRRGFTSFDYFQKLSEIEAKLTRIQVGPEYAHLEMENPVEKFLAKFIYSSARMTNLTIVSPYIGVAEGPRVSLQRACSRIEREKIPTYVITTEPTEDYHKKGIDLLNACKYVELRFNKQLHAKVFVAMALETSDAFGMFGSGNLTTAAMEKNIEIGMLILGRGHGRDILKQLYHWSCIQLRTFPGSTLVKKITINRRT